MAFLTLSEVRSRAKSNRSFGLESRDILEEQFDSFKSYKTYDIFLSHAFLDAKAIDGLKVVLEEAGFSVYVDWHEDSHLERGKVTKETALVIRERMKSCRTLIFAMTQNSHESRWMLWELGYFDGYKNKVAILPLTERRDDNFNGQEFISLYPLVEIYGDSFYINNPFESIENWINE
ncbi:MAG: toll/interleukin-1 receptor domain-containing protein [Psychrobacter sp.]